MSKHGWVRRWQRGQSPGKRQSPAQPREWEFLLVSSQGGARPRGWIWLMSPSHRPATPPRSGLPGDTSGVGVGRRGDAVTVGVLTQSPTGQDVLRLRTGTGTAGSSWGKGDNTEGHTAPSRPTTPPAMVLQPWLDPCLPPAPKHHPGGQRGHPASPHPQGTPRGLWDRSGSLAGLTWRLLVSPWSQALLVCFCFSAEGRQGVNPSGGAGGAASQ